MDVRVWHVGQDGDRHGATALVERVDRTVCGSVNRTVNRTVVRVLPYDRIYDMCARTVR